jgi:ketosteroid isomerase-like protein
MRKLSFIPLAVVSICLFVAPLALGQGGSPPASTKESGKTSGKGMTAAEQTGKGGKGGNVEQQIRVLSDQAVQASLKGDASFYEKYLADDATIIHSDDKLSSKAQEIENLKSGSLKYESLEEHETKIRVYGNTAVAVTLVSAKGTFRGKPFSGEYRATRIWVKQNGNWTIVEFQASGGAGAFQH